MKVTLFALNGSYNHTNLAIRRLSPPLEAADFEVILLEGGLRDGDAALLEALVSARSEIYGFSTYIWNVSRMLTLAENLKRLKPSSYIIFGGPEVSYAHERFTSLRFIDCVVTGAGEEALTKVCSDIRNGTAPSKLCIGGEPCLSEGILYRPDEPTRATMYYESSVGCPFSCAFCLSSATNGVKAKSVSQTLSELYEFEKTEGDFIIKLVDRTFNFDVKRANAILAGLLDPKYTKRYQLEVCASLFDEESFQLLSEFPNGKLQLEAGLQSTCGETLRAVARHTDADATLSACRRIMSHGNIHVHLDLIAGLPFEDIFGFERSFNAAYPCCHQLQLGFLKLLHGTALRRDAEKYGYIFTAEPPYTVLQTKWLSYDELRLLDTISELVERYHNSAHFNEGLEYALSHASSPFAFFTELADHIKKADGRSIRKIGQNDAYSLLWSYGKGILGIDEDTLSEKLHSDYARFEVRGRLKLNRG